VKEKRNWIFNRYDHNCFDSCFCRLFTWHVVAWICSMSNEKCSINTHVSCFFRVCLPWYMFAWICSVSNEKCSVNTHVSCFYRVFVLICVCSNMLSIKINWEMFS